MLRVRQHLGKYRIERRLAVGGFATVYKAYDTIAGIHVALKTPHPGLVTRDTLDNFRKEVRVTARLDHPNILPVKDAGFVEGTFVIAYPLGEGTLGDKLNRRVSARTLMNYAEQMLEAVAHAHDKRVMHCDLKPENFILFADNWLRLADFGIAKVAQRTIPGSGTGTVGYIAPEQALGKPSFRSDVFSLGLILYRMFSGQLPEWPFEWPPPGIARMKKYFHPDLIELVRRAIEVDARRRFPDVTYMNAAFQRVRPRAIRVAGTVRRRRMVRKRRDWRTVRHREFLRQYRRVLEVRGECHRCHGPVAETMQVCPWCAAPRKIAPREHRFRAECPRCHRSLKTDWRYCPWCYGAAVQPDAVPRFSDVRYSARCPNQDCTGKDLMPFMRYCPWCQQKVRRRWTIEGTRQRCPRCGWGVARDFWDHCPWCARALKP